MTLVTFLLLKYKYYIHHIITMIIYCALGICIDAIIGNFFNIKLIIYFICLLSAINESLLYGYLKYMMDKLYYEYYEVILYYGISGLITRICLIIGKGIYQYKNNNNGNSYTIFNSIMIYFKTTNVATIIFSDLIFSCTILY